MDTATSEPAIKANTEADARAKILIYLIERRLVSASDL